MDKRILIVDDEIPIAEILKINLEKEGYTTLVAHDGQTALDDLAKKGKGNFEASVSADEEAVFLFIRVTAYNENCDLCKS